ncbi:helix-turn-helix transcriptional regulator, partial [Streptomyces sp900116325]|uniref:helix-turn-helix domain-containing protein n=1 Tax=Streptomyces sp. 900116325 TaxID=3154295 RepID=UPI00331B0B9F
MPNERAVGTIQRIEANRKMRHLTQRAFAHQAGVSYSLYTKVATGSKRTTPAFVAACARALGMEVGELYGQPYRDELLEERISYLIQPIVHVMDLYDLDPQDGLIPRPVGELTAEVEHLGDLHDAGAFSLLAERVPGLIEEVRAAALASGDPLLWDLLAQAYRAVYDIGGRFGYLAVSRTAMDRCEWAAARAGDAEAPLRAMRQYQRSLIHLKQGDYASGLRMYAAGRAIIDAVGDTPLTLAVRGQLMLGAALLSARAGRRDDATELIGEARSVAARTGEQPRAYWMGWGPTNVTSHEIKLWAESDDPSRAVAAARDVRLPEDWPPSRVAPYWMS